MVTDVGGLGDKSFNDLSLRGSAEGARPSSASRSRSSSPRRSTDYETNLTQLANAGYNPIFAVGFLMTDTVSQDRRPQFPDVNFGGIDEFFDPTRPTNVVGLNFKEQEAGYLAGVVAGDADHR